MDYSHPDLLENLWSNLAERNGSPRVDDDGNGYVDDIHGINAYSGTSDPLDDHGHGTHVAGTIGAVGNNGIGIAGINWHVQIVPCKFLGWDGSGYTDGAVECLEYIRALKDRGVNIIATNNSWGGGGFSQALYDAIDAQRESDILFVAAAGNAVMDNDSSEFYPANYYLPNLISVAATDDNDSKAGFSNYGRRTVHVGAPGTNIVSLRAQGTDMYGDGQHFVPPDDPDTEYYRASGTSMATPHVTGLAGLIKSQNPNRDWADIKNLILSGTREDIPFYGMAIGGRIDAYASLTCSHSPVFSALKFPVSFQAGVPTPLSALSIDCEFPWGPVTVTTSSGEVIHLNDDGIFPDLAAGDGIFSASWTPTSAFSYLTFSSPAGTEVVPTPSILTNALPLGLVNNYYRQTLRASGGGPPYAWSVNSGSLPDGLNLNRSTGEISGVPSKTGTYFFSIKVTDSRTSLAMKGYSITVKDVDLIITSVSGPASGSLGQSITMTSTVKNLGTGDSVGSYMTLYLSSDSTINTSDYALTTLYAGTLTAGTQRTFNKNVMIPSNLAPGIYYIGAIADTGNRVVETNENNNSLAGNQISVGSKVDLVITSVSGPTSASPREQVAFTAAVKNQGNAASGGFYLSVYLSADSTLTREDMEMGSVYVTGLAAGVQQVLKVNSTLPAAVAGFYYIGAIADSRNNVSETNENNNSLTGNQISITLPDLMLTSVSGPSGGIAGQQISITTMIKNNGGTSWGGFYLSVYLSTDPVITPWDDVYETGDLEIGSVYVPSLGAGAQQMLTISSTIPATLTGVYYLGAIVDSYNWVVESNENNNSLAGGQTSISKR